MENNRIEIPPINSSSPPKPACCGSITGISSNGVAQYSCGLSRPFTFMSTIGSSPPSYTFTTSFPHPPSIPVNPSHLSSDSPLPSVYLKLVGVLGLELGHILFDSVTVQVSNVLTLCLPFPASSRRFPSSCWLRSFPFSCIVCIVLHPCHRFDLLSLCVSSCHLDLFLQADWKG